MNEPAYIRIPRGLLVERLGLRPDGTTPPERKVYVFDGRAKFIGTSSPGANGLARFGDVHSRD